MMGAAAARHLASEGASVALIGPDEPADRMRHDGVFASHYDEGRITRTIDPDADWALLARRSIARYRAIEAESGIPFYTEAGCLISGPTPRGEGGYLDAVVAARDRLQVDAPLLDPAEIAARFPWFAVPATSAGVYFALGYRRFRTLIEAGVPLGLKAGICDEEALRQQQESERQQEAVDLGTEAAPEAEPETTPAPLS